MRWQQPKRVAPGGGCATLQLVRIGRIDVRSSKIGPTLSLVHEPRPQRSAVRAPTRPPARGHIFEQRAHVRPPPHPPLLQSVSRSRHEIRGSCGGKLSHRHVPMYTAHAVGSRKTAVSRKQDPRHSSLSYSCTHSTVCSAGSASDPPAPGVCVRACACAMRALIDPPTATHAARRRPENQKHPG